jgi:prepilin peptidase CpaA
MQTMSEIALWPTVGVLAVATITDLCSRRIPNWLVVPFLVLGLVVSAVLCGWAGVGQSLLGVLAAVLVLGVFCWLGGMGMGDLKLCAAIGAWIGPAQLFTALVMTGIAGGVIALCWALAGGFLKESLGGAALLIFGHGRNLLRARGTEAPANSSARGIPYAPAIAIGTICSFLSGHV